MGSEKKKTVFASTRYINYFLSWIAATELMPFFRASKGTSAKEVTESIACYEAVRKHIGLDPKDENVNVLVVGDGVKPRTASIFAYLTKWEATSIDPLMNKEWFENLRDEKARWGIPVRNLYACAGNAEQLIFDYEGKDLILVFPHSHAPMEKVLERYRGKCKSLHIVSMPCCEPQSTTLLKIPHIHYVDENVWSAKNQIYVWKNLENAVN